MDNEALIRRWFEEVWSKGRVEVIDEMFPVDGIAHGLAGDGGDMRGPEAFKVFHKTFRGAFPDMQVLVEDILSQGDKVAVRFVVQATHTGDDLGIPATGKRVRCTGMTFARFNDGKIVEGWNNVDIASLLDQIRAA
jgi:steroid delta-isomerase-like uncharacterized protein